MRSFAAFSLPRNIWAIGLMTMLMNLSTIVIFSLSPIYLTQVMGVTNLGIGRIEGAVELISWVTRVFSGVISDAFRKRKALILLAVAVTTIARPLFAMASAITGIFVSRALDRVANGLQAPPRDALIGDSSPKGRKGESYGLRQSLGMVGSSVGAVVTMWWLYKYGENFSQIFWAACIPPVFAFLIVLGMIRDIKPAEKPKKKQSAEKSFHLNQVMTLSRDYWKLLLVSFIFCMATYSGAFMILRAEEVAHMALVGPAVMIFQNTMAMLVAYPVGRLFDRFDHRFLLAAGFLVVIGANTLFSLGNTFTYILIGASLWGVQMGTNQSLLTAKVAATTEKNNRGTGFGVYFITAGLGIYFSNEIVGRLADKYDLTVAFYFSSVMALIAILCLPLLKKK